MTGVLILRLALTTCETNRGRDRIAARMPIRDITTFRVELPRRGGVAPNCSGGFGTSLWQLFN